MIAHRLPRLDQLCPYCAAFPSIACAEATNAAGPIFYGRTHVGDPDFIALLALVDLVDGLRSWATMGVAARATVAV